jgi:hypothetical protein
MKTLFLLITLMFAIQAPIVARQLTQGTGGRTSTAVMQVRATVVRETIRITDDSVRIMLEEGAEVFVNGDVYKAFSMEIQSLKNWIAKTDTSKTPIITIEFN